MRDRYEREISYLRVSVTDRCDLRCQYCMPAGQEEWFERPDVLTDAEIVECVRVAITLGITKVRLTGGEPLVRPGIVGLVKQLAALPGIGDLALTTNGMSLARLAPALAEAGLQRVNVSMDSLDEGVFWRITGGGDLRRVQEGILAALAAGLRPVKINVVLLPGVNAHERESLVQWAEEHGAGVRFIRQMSLEEGVFAPVEGGDGGKCGICNRIRLLSDGTVKPCLFGTEGFNVREVGIETAFRLAVGEKPAVGTHNATGRFNRIGG
jgi:cyclic pyranopterin phosphate synthase